MKKRQTLFVSMLIIVIIFIAILPLSTGQIIDSPSLEASLSYQDPDPVEPGDEVELKFSIKNNGTSTAKSAEFQIEPAYPFTLAPGEEEIKEAGDIKVYNVDEIDTEEITLKFKIIIDEHALDGDYDLRLEYRTEGGVSNGNWLEFDAFIVSVGSKATNLILQETKTNPEAIGPGESGELVLTLANIGNSDIDDITITVDTENLTEISPLKTSNELIISGVEVGKSVQATFSFIVAPDALVKIYKIPLILAYSDERNNEYEKTTYVSLVVNEEPEYILNMEETDVYKQKQSGDVVISLSNIGVADINYATITLKENQWYKILSADAVYLGNLESDDFETAEFTIYTTDYAEEIPLEFVLFYKDNYNKNYQENVTLQMKLFTSSEAKRYGLTTGSRIWPILVLIIAGAAGYYWWKKWKKQKK